MKPNTQPAFFPGLNFVAIDFETANYDLDSICQVGIACFEDGVCVEQKDWVVDPEGEFLPSYVRLHGIEARHAAGAPLFPDIFADFLAPAVQGQVVVSHGHFDRQVLMAACARYGLDLPEMRWMDSVMLARRTWEDVRAKGANLATLSQRLGISFQHHQAGEDARVAGQVVVAAAIELGLAIEECVARCDLAIDQAFGRVPVRSRAERDQQRAVARKYREKILREPSELEKAIHDIRSSPMDEGDLPLAGHSVAFTGTLSVGRALAEAAVKHLGGECTDSPNQRTTIFVAGTPDLVRNRGQEKGSKYRKAEALIEKGQDLRILKEADFVRWLVGAWSE